MKRILTPSLSDVFFFSLLVWLFAAGPYGWSSLLADGDTGWHIRAGDYMLERRALPERDPFSFSKPHEVWYAWEWLSDALMSLLHKWWGLKGVTMAAGLLAAGAMTVVFRYALWRGASLWIALPACLLAAGASSIHYLARPHMATLLLLPVSLWLLDRDRRSPDRAVWLLVPLAALWTNLHAGSIALLACLAVYAAAGRRYVALLGACAGATLLNPYGWRLHAHVWSYLRSDWIRQAVDEFQAPDFRSESLMQFELLLGAGALTAASLLFRRKFVLALLIAMWAHGALTAVRNVPLYAVVAAPLVASELTLYWRRFVRRTSARGAGRILERMAWDFRAGLKRSSVWPAAGAAALLAPVLPARWPADFPADRFPTAIIARQAARLEGARVFTSDEWSDYLLYRFHPRTKVFIDGRSDFYGPQLGRAYVRTLQGQPGWREELDRWGIERVLAPPDWPLAGLLEQRPEWRLVDKDGSAKLFERIRPAVARAR